ncbi:glycosyltransferase [Pseudooceanicola sp.]|uniref:glycosyltransferase n=1 Tax=Pseudooceanicola sp. TaxID=1914328 RepID=UPI0035190559
MRILRLILTVDPAYGGPIAGISAITPCLAARGHSTTIASLDAPDAAFLAGQSRGIGARIVPLGPGRFRCRYTGRLRQWLAAQAAGFDIAVLHGLWNYAVIGGGHGLKAAGLPYVVYAHGMMDPYFARIAPLKFRAKRLAWTLTQGAVLHHAQRVLFTSQQEQRLATRTFPRPRYHARVIAYGAKAAMAASEETGALVAALPRLRGRRYLLYLGRIHEKKGADLLIDAFAQLAATDPALDLVIAGPEPDGFGQRLRQQACALGIAHRLHWPGLIRGAVKAAAFGGAEAFVLPSHQENFGIAVVEALSHGCPVLISDQVNICSEIAQAGAGLVAPDTPDGVVQLLTCWSALPAGQRAEMARSARRLFQERFTPQAAAADLDEVLTAAIRSGARTAGKAARPLPVPPALRAAQSGSGAGPKRHKTSAPHPAQYGAASSARPPAPPAAPIGNSP